jgi:TRAP-type C4-dicarboxylate transport system permease small subunit
MVINVLWQVATRFLINDPSSYTEEIARILLIWIGLLGGSYAYRTGAHIGLDIITKKLSGTTQHAVEVFALMIVFLFALSAMLYGGSQLVLLTLELKQTSASLGIPMGYVYFVIPLSGGLICLYSLVNLLDLINHSNNSKGSH